MRGTNVLAKNINRLRNHRNWTQQQLADFAQVSLQTVFRAESKNKVPRGENLAKIARALGVTESDLYKDPSAVMPTEATATSQNTDRNQLILDIQDKLKTLTEAQLEALSDSIEHLKNPVLIDETETNDLKYRSK